jgi:transposase, IS6 family
VPAGANPFQIVRYGHFAQLCGHWADKYGTPADFLLTATRDLQAAKRFFRKMLQDQPLLAPDRIGTDRAGPCPPAIVAARKDELLPQDPLPYVSKHLQQGIEMRPFPGQETHAADWRLSVFHTARRMIRGFKAMPWLRKGFGFAGTWTMCEQNRLLSVCFGILQVNKA